MSRTEVPRITNLWSKVVDGEGGEWLSKVVLESTRRFAHGVFEKKGTVVVEGRGVILNMPAGTIEVNDGLIRELNTGEENDGVTRLEVKLDFPADFYIKAVTGFPYRLEIYFNRRSIEEIFKGRKVVVDPAHGGRDTGGRGQVSLLEKDIVLLIAENLEKLLVRAGALPVMTRKGDAHITLEERLRMARAAGADAYIGIHNHAGPDKNVEGVFTLYKSDDQSLRLAQLVQGEVVKKLKAADRGVAVNGELSPLGDIPGIEVEVLAITNLVEEVFLRGLTVRKRAAEGIFNGLLQFFAK